MLIAIEGIDGSGKATQTKLLVEHLRRAKCPVETLNFPRYEQNFFGQLVRRYLSGEFGPPTACNPYLASLLYAFDRWESSAQMKSWLAKGNVVVLDRYVASNLIHQAIKLGPAEQPAYSDWLLQLEHNVLGLPKPDLTLLLELPVQVAYELIHKRGGVLDGHERELSHLEAAAAMCRTLTGKFKWQTITCAARGQLLPPQVIHDEVWRVVHRALELPPEVS